MQIYDLLLTEDYEQDGKERTHFTNVGVAFTQKNGPGFNLEIRPGIALSGRVLMLPRKNKDERQG